MKKKIISLIIIVSILTAFAVTLAGCNGNLTVYPVKNSEFITKIETVVWDEGARYSDNCTFNVDVPSVSELTSGTAFTRFDNLALKIANNKYDGKEFFMVCFDITADRDVDFDLYVWYGATSKYKDDANIRMLKSLSLKANETQKLELNLSKNFTVHNGDNTPYVCFWFRGDCISGTDAFADYVATQYSIANLEFYAN